MTARFFFSQDRSSHWYMIPAERREDWSAFCSLDEDDERSWNAPEWAERIDGAVQWWTFERPECER